MIHRRILVSRTIALIAWLQSYYLFADKLGHPAKGNDKDKVEGIAGYSRRNFMVPIPRASSWEELNEFLAQGVVVGEFGKLQGAVPGER